MSVILCIISVLLALACAACTVWYQNAYITESKPGFTETLKQHKKLLVILALSFTAIAVWNAVTQHSRNVRSDLLIHDLMIWYGVAAAAVIDFKVKKIPNKIVQALLIVHIVFIIIGIIFNHDPVMEVIVFSLAGMALGGGFMLICMFFSKGGIGAGDMKLYAVIGFCFGLIGAIQVMIYSMVISAVFCIGLLIFRKAKMRSTVPMAPFILAGLTVFYLLYIS